MRVFSALALFVASTLAFTVTKPATDDTWDLNASSQTVTWTSVSSDRSNFSIVLTNQESQPSYSQVLKALVVATDGTTTVSPPATGWPSGSGFQVNLVQDATDLNAILAQSGKFNISVSTSSQSSSSHSSTLIASNPASTPSSTGSGEPSGTSDTSTTPHQSGGAVGLNIQTGFIASVALLGAILA